MYKLTCFMKEDHNILFPMLLPLRFKWSERQSVVWEDGENYFRIVPFAVNGRETKGYRIYFKGSSESFRYLINQFLGCFKPTISAIEWISNTDKSQSELIRLAKQKRYLPCSMYGIYEHDGVGIVLMPNSEIHLQIRNQPITFRNLPHFLEKLNGISSSFTETPYDLFSFAKGAEIV